MHRPYFAEPASTSAKALAGRAFLGCVAKGTTKSRTIGRIAQGRGQPLIHLLVDGARLPHPRRRP